MSLTAIIAATGYGIAYALIIHGLVGIVDIDDRGGACRICIVTRSAEVAGGIFIIAGVMAVMEGFL